MHLLYNFPGLDLTIPLVKNTGNSTFLPVHACMYACVYCSHVHFMINLTKEYNTINHVHGEAAELTCFPYTVKMGL